MARALLTLMARIISTVFSPFVVAVPLAVGLSVTYATSATEALKWGLIAVGAAVGFPLTVILLLIQLGAAGDLHLSLRSDRPLPFLLGIASGLLGLYLLILTGAPRGFVTVALAFIFTGLILTFTTLFWKVSVHMAATTAVAATAALVYGQPALPLFLALPVIGWARFYLGKHTLLQLS
ncbi:MAG: hypothetical protein ACE5E0_06760, partial [Terriglobia bacterium]